MTWATLDFEEDGSWWSSVQKCGATIALAAVMATTGASTAQATQVFSWQQDEAPSKPIQDEDFWQNPVAPVPSTIYQKLPYTPDPEEIPAGNLSAVPEELYWQLGPAPVPATLLWPQQWAFDVQEPAGSLSAPAEEYYWQNPVFPVPSIIYQSLPYWFDAQDVFPVLFQPDEDYWLNPVAPIAGTLYQTLPYLFDAQEIVVGVFAPDEDFWQSPVVTQLTFQYFQPWPISTDDGQFVSPPTPGTGVLWLPYWGLPLSRLMRG